MKLVSANDSHVLVGKCVDWLRNTIEVYDLKRIFIPAGRSPIGLYQWLEENKPPFMNGITLIQIDDVISHPGKDMFQKFFKEHLPSFDNQVQFIDREPRSADAAILGIGLNGHVAFHEPGLARDFAFGEIELSDLTCQNLGIPSCSRGLSYGLGSFMQTERILVMVSGEKKRDIFLRMLEKDPALPASALLDHPDVTIIYQTDVAPSHEIAKTTD